MAKRYLSRDELNFFACLSAFASFLGSKVDGLSDKHTNIKAIRQKLRSARTLTDTAANLLVQPLDPIDRAHAELEGAKMRVVTRYSDEALREYKATQAMDSTVTLPTDDYLDIVAHCIEGPCRACQLQGEAVESCNVRRILLNTDIEPYDLEAPVGKCPYKL